MTIWTSPDERMLIANNEPTFLASKARVNIFHDACICWPHWILMFTPLIGSIREKAIHFRIANTVDQTLRRITRVCCHLHTYYYQVQTQIFVCSADYADFVVATYCNSEVNFSIQRILEYFNWRVTVLLKHLHRAFSICSCLLLYNSLIFNSILLSFGKSRFLWPFHLPSKFKIILPCCLCNIGDFLNMQSRSEHLSWCLHMLTSPNPHVHTPNW